PFLLVSSSFSSSSSSLEEGGRAEGEGRAEQPPRHAGAPLPGAGRCSPGGPRGAAQLRPGELRSVGTAAPATDLDHLRPPLAKEASPSSPRLRKSRSQVSFLSVSDSNGVSHPVSDGVALHRGGTVSFDLCQSVSTLRNASSTAELKARQQFAEKFKQDAEESG
ncbi:unnamed protein product, partial [Prorocentrum cordatum]